MWTNGKSSFPALRHNDLISLILEYRFPIHTISIQGVRAYNQNRCGHCYLSFGTHYREAAAKECKDCRHPEWSPADDPACSRGPTGMKDIVDGLPPGQVLRVADHTTVSVFFLES